jgi:hypothetical protein
MGLALCETSAQGIGQGAFSQALLDVYQNYIPTFYSCSLTLDFWVSSVTLSWQDT